MMYFTFHTKRTLATFLALSLLVSVFGSAIFGCGGGSKFISDLTPESDIGPQKGLIHYINDHLGNAHLITDSQGNILREESRYPYGLDWRVDGSDATTADYVYTGKEYDEETGLVYFGGRYYSPEMGRWITPDPLFLEKPATVAERPLESNLYSFTRGNPIVFVDSNGLGSWAVTGGPFDISYGVPDSWYRYGGNWLDVPYLAVNFGANVVGYATYGAEKVLNYAGTSLDEVTFAFVALGPEAPVAARCASAWVGSRMLGARTTGVLAAKEGKFVDLYRGSINHYSEIMENGLDISKGRVFISRDLKAAENAIGPYRYDVAQGAAKDIGIIHSRVPEPLFEKHFLPYERPYPYGYGAHLGVRLDSTEIPIGTAEQFEIFNKHIVK